MGLFTSKLTALAVPPSRTPQATLRVTTCDDPHLHCFPPTTPQRIIVVGSRREFERLFPDGRLDLSPFAPLEGETPEKAAGYRPSRAAVAIAGMVYERVYFLSKTRERGVPKGMEECVVRYEDFGGEPCRDDGGDNEKSSGRDSGENRDGLVEDMKTADGTNEESGEAQPVLGCLLIIDIRISDPSAPFATCRYNVYERDDPRYPRHLMAITSHDKFVVLIRRCHREETEKVHELSAVDSILRSTSEREGKSDTYISARKRFALDRHG